jgi:hypothetical protein
MLRVADVSDRWGRLLYFAAVPGFRFSGGPFGPRRSASGLLGGVYVLLTAGGVHVHRHVSETVVSAASAGSVCALFAHYLLLRLIE